MVFLYILLIGSGCTIQEEQQIDTKDSEKKAAEEEETTPAKDLSSKMQKLKDEKNITLEIPEFKGEKVKLGERASVRLYKLIKDAEEVNTVINKTWTFSFEGSLPDLYFSPETMQVQFKGEREVYQLPPDMKTFMQNLYKVPGEDKWVLEYTYQKEKHDLNGDGQRENIQLVYEGGKVNLRINDQKRTLFKPNRKKSDPLIKVKKFHILKDQYIVIGKVTPVLRIGTNAEWNVYQWKNDEINLAFSPGEHEIEFSYIDNQKVKLSFDPYPYHQMIPINPEEVKRYPLDIQGSENLIKEAFDQKSVSLSTTTAYYVNDYDHDGNQEIMENRMLAYPTPPYTLSTSFILYEMTDDGLEATWMYFGKRLERFKDLFRNGSVPNDQIDQSMRNMLNRGVLQDFDNKVYIRRDAK